jgi:hypothetical protein
MAFKIRSQNNFAHSKTISLSINRRGRLLSTTIQYARYIGMQETDQLVAVRLQ